MKKILTIGLLSFSLVACSGQEINKENVNVENETIETLPNSSSDTKDKQKIETQTQIANNEDDSNHIQNEETITNEPSIDTETLKPVEQQIGDSLVTKKGIFFGLADNSSAEFQVDGQSAVYLFSDEVFEQLNNMDYEANVEFTYFVNETGQNVINDIKKI